MPAGINTLLSESTPLLVNQRRTQGAGHIRALSFISVEGENSVSLRVAELSEVDAIIAVTPGRPARRALC